jgi:ABC-type nitrate/sulfonate/bicarbonate transport system permease component
MAVIEQPGAASVALEPERASSLRVPGMALWRLASLALFCGLWEVAGRIPINPAFPPFSDTLAAGVVVSALLGVSVGVLIGLRRIAEWLIAPIFIVLQAAPMAALIPLVTFVYGIGITAKIMSVCILALPVIVLNSYKAIRNVNPSLIAMCRSFLGSRPQQIVKIMLPDAAPLIFAGLRLGVSAGFIGVILAELLITPTGIGDLITFHQSTASYPEMYAAITSIVAFSALTLMVLQWVEVRLFRPEMRGA